MLYFPHPSAHGFRNIGATTGKTVWLSTSGANVDPFFHALGALPAGAPDMQQVASIFARHDMQVLPPPAAWLTGEGVKMQDIETGRALLDAMNAHDLSRWEAQLADNFTASYWNQVELLTQLGLA